MRRRIYDFDLSDVTNDPYMFDEDNGDHVRALYDEALWEKLVKARKYVHELEGEVARALVVEPFDEVERALHAEAIALAINEKWSTEASDSIRERALAHAKTRKDPRHVDGRGEKYKARCWCGAADHESTDHANR